MAQTWPQHSSQEGSTWVNVGQTEANIGQKVAQHEPKIAQHRPNLGQMDLANISPRWAQDGSTWARLGPTWAQPALNIGPDCFHTGKHCALCLPQFNIALPGFARRISAQSSHTISQKSLLGRRPAVRLKPLNLGAGLGARVLAGGLRW